MYRKGRLNNLICGQVRTIVTGKFVQHILVQVGTNFIVLYFTRGITHKLSTSTSIFNKNTQIRQQELLQACSNFSTMLCILNFKNVIKAKNNQVNYFPLVFSLTNT